MSIFKIWLDFQCFNLCYFINLQTQNTVYEIVSDMSTRQDTLEDRLATVEDKLVTLQEQIDLLPDLIATRIQAQVNQQNFICIVVLSLIFKSICHRLKKWSRGEIFYIQNQQLVYNKHEVYLQLVRGLVQLYHL